MLQAASQRSALKTNKEQLVKEYAFIMNLGVVDPQCEQLFTEAVRYVQVCLLSDLRPPWADYNFPQALPGNGMLSNYTRPSFLNWKVADAVLVFGNAVNAKLRRLPPLPH